jgi:V8-like Glu-specific endopeptidase
MYSDLLPNGDGGRQGLLGLALLLTLASACGAPESAPEVAVRAEAVVYGGDDRQDYFAHPDAAMRALGASSSAALVDGRLLEAMPDGRVRVPLEPFGELYGLCEGERFAEQPSLAHCSGTLVAEDLVLTSAHCLDVVPCAQLGLVFGFLYEDAGELAELTDADVYACSEVVTQARTDARGRAVDHAWIRLDRPVASHLRPAAVFSGDAPLERGQALTVIGFSAGLPMKIDSGAQVVDGRDGALDFFRATSDTFHGSSGSGVFDGEGRLRGVLARGAEDWLRAGDGCMTARSDSNDVIDQREEATYVARALDGLCESSAGDAGLCAQRAAGAGAPQLAAAAAPTCSGSHPGTPPRGSALALLGALLLIALLRRRLTA